MDFSDQIANALADYSSEVQKDLEEIKEDVADKTVDYLRDNSPVGYRGKYAKGWRKKKDGTGYVIHNATDYQLTHILERGHAKRNGGRTKALPHIGEAERLAIESMEVRIQQ